jgi:hypothetical protein
MGITCEKRNCGVVVRIRKHTNFFRDETVHDYAVEWSGMFCSQHMFSKVFFFSCL